MATTITKTVLVGIFPEFASVNEQRVTDVNPYAALFIDDDKFGTSEPYGKLLMVAHILKVGDQAGKGPVLSSKVGSLSRSYGNPAVSGYLGETVYGKQFLNLVNIVVCPATIGYTT